LDICEAPESYPIQEGRLLVRCKQKAELACLDIKKDQGNFGGDNDLRTLTRNASFGIRENIFCFVLKNFSEK
jgi:hypothetical protein